MRFTTQFNAGVAVCLLIETLGPAMANAAEPGGAPAEAAPVVSDSAGRSAPEPALPAGFELPKLVVGDPAPPVLVDEYLVGGSPKSPGTVTVVEFWALWCGPCLAGMPHLSELQKQWGTDRLQIVGVTSPDRNNQKPDVVKFLQQKPVEYAIGWDEQRRTWPLFMSAAEQKAIPCAFVIDAQNRIAWIGHPGKIDAPLKSIIEGRWDIARARTEYIKRLVGKGTGQSLLAQYREAVKAKDWERTVTLAAQVRAIDPEEFGVWSANAFGSILSGLGDHPRALVYANGLLAPDSEVKDQLEVLERLASLVADAGDAGELKPAEPTDQEILDLGLACALRARELSPSVVTSRTLARVRWVRGERREAIAILREAAKKETSDFRVRVLESMAEHWERQLTSENGDQPKPVEGKPDRTP